MQLLLTYVAHFYLSSYMCNIHPPDRSKNGILISYYSYRNYILIQMLCHSMYLVLLRRARLFYLNWRLVTSKRMFGMMTVSVRRIRRTPAKPAKGRFLTLRSVASQMHRQPTLHTRRPQETQKVKNAQAQSFAVTFTENQGHDQYYVVT